MRLKLTLPVDQYDALYAAARRAEVSIPEVIRRQLRARRQRSQGQDDEDSE